MNFHSSLSLFVAILLLGPFVQIRNLSLSIALC